MTEKDAMYWINFVLVAVNSYATEKNANPNQIQRMASKIVEFLVGLSSHVGISCIQSLVHKEMLSWLTKAKSLKEKAQQQVFWNLLTLLTVFAKRFIVCQYLYPAINPEEQIEVQKWEDLWIQIYQLFSKCTVEIDDVEGHEQCTSFILLIISFLTSEHLYEKRMTIFALSLRSLLQLFVKEKIVGQSIVNYTPSIRSLLHRLIGQSSTKDVFQYQILIKTWLEEVKANHLKKAEEQMLYERMYVDLLSCF